MYNVYGPDGRILFNTPHEDVLVRVLGLGKEAMARVEREARHPGSCTLHANSGQYFLGILPRVLVSIS
jgi:hypothetical protein